MQLLQQRGLDRDIDVDSAGTGAWHAGSPPDERASAEASRRGISLDHQRARKVRDEDFENFDLIVAMDSDNLSDLKQRCPKPYRDRLHRCMDFAPTLGLQDVPDPYYGGNKGFVKVFDLVEQACNGLLDHIESTRL